MLIRVKNICVLICALLSVTLLLTGCAEQSEMQAEPEALAVVYDDGVYIIEAAAPSGTTLEDGSTRTDIRLMITNRSLDKLVISSVLGVRVSVMDTECQLTVADGLVPIDGMVMPEEIVEGYISFITSSEPEVCKIELAVDYLGDQWISFEVSR